MQFPLGYLPREQSLRVPLSQLRVQKNLLSLTCFPPVLKYLAVLPAEREKIKKKKKKVLFCSLSRWDREVSSPQTEAGPGPGPSITMENSHCRRQVIKNIVSIILFEQNHPELLVVVLESPVAECRSDAHRLGWLRGNGEPHLAGTLG